MFFAVFMTLLLPVVYEEHSPVDGGCYVYTTFTQLVVPIHEEVEGSNFRLSGLITRFKHP